MPFPSSDTATTSDALLALRQGASQIKSQTTQIRAQSLTGTLSANLIVVYLGYLRAVRARMVALAATPSLAAYAQQQLGNASFDVAAAFTAMTAALDATTSWVATNLPKDGSGYLLAVQMDAQGVTTDRVFDSATLAGFRTQLDALLATIS